MTYKNTGLQFLGGAIVGATAMYLLDPEAGERRRHAVAAKAGDAWHGTGDQLGEAWEHAHKLGADLIGHAQDLGSGLVDRVRAGAAGAADQVGDARDQAAGGLKGLGDRVADLGQELIGRARKAAGQARSSVDQAQQSAWDSTHPLRHRIAGTLDPEHQRGPGHAVAYSSAGVGAVALGAAAMYFLDPAKGQERRDNVVSQVSHCMQETGHLCRAAGQYVMRLWRGQTRGTNDNLEPSDPIVGEQLVGRVRAEIGHLLANPAQVQLMADADGIVTLYGKIPANELEAVLVAINKVEGVRAVVDRLDDRSVEIPSPIEASPQM